MLVFFPFLSSAASNTTRSFPLPSNKRSPSNSLAPPTPTNSPIPTLSGSLSVDHPSVSLSPDLNYFPPDDSSGSDGDDYGDDDYGNDDYGEGYGDGDGYGDVGGYVDEDGNYHWPFDDNNQEDEMAENQRERDYSEEEDVFEVASWIEIFRTLFFVTLGFVGLALGVLASHLWHRAAAQHRLDADVDEPLIAREL